MRAHELKTCLGRGAAGEHKCSVDSIWSECAESSDVLAPASVDHGVCAETPDERRGGAAGCRRQHTRFAAFRELYCNRSDRTRGPEDKHGVVLAYAKHVIDTLQGRQARRCSGTRLQHVESLRCACDKLCGYRNVLGIESVLTICVVVRIDSFTEAETSRPRAS
jgi:hypothetical protein